MDVPGLGLTKPSDQNSIIKSMQLDITIVRGGDDKPDGNVFLVYDLNSVDGGSVSDDEVLLDELAVRFLIVEVYFADVPVLELA